MLIRRALIVISLLLVLVIAACQGNPSPVVPTTPSTVDNVPTSTPSPEPTAPPVETSAPSSTQVPTPTNTPVPTLPPTPTPSPTPMPTATPVSTPTPTPIPTATPVSTPTPPTPGPTPLPIRPTGWSTLPHVDWLEANRPLIVTDITAVWWVADGIAQQHEQHAVEQLVALAAWSNMDRASFQRILKSPFLEEVTSPDVWALHELRYFVVNEWSYFQQLMAHPMITEGITDRTAKLLGALYVLDYDRNLRPLNEGTFILTQVVNLKASGQTHLTVLRVGTVPSETTMSRLEQTMYGLDALLGLPLPTNNILLVVADRVYGDHEGYGGLHYGGQMVILERFDTDGTGVWEFCAGTIGCEGAFAHIGHESAHYFFLKGPFWIVEGFTEGAQEIVEAIVEGETVSLDHPEFGTCPGITTFPQVQAARLKADNDFSVIVSPFDGFGRDRESDVWHCEFHFGKHIFTRLYLELEPSVFQAGLQQLYLKTKPFSTEALPTVEDVVAAFGPKAEAIIYGEQP